MRRYIVHISWLLVVLFFISSTGVAAYEHICNTEQTRSISWKRDVCTTEKNKSIDCCSHDEQDNTEDENCCDESGFIIKVESEFIKDQSQIIQKLLAAEHLQLPLFEWNNWLPTELISLTINNHSPPEHSTAHLPEADTKRALIQTYLC